MSSLRQVYPRIDYRTITGVEATLKVANPAVEDETRDPATLPKFNITPEKLPPEKGKDRLPFPSFFMGFCC